MKKTIKYVLTMILIIALIAAVAFPAFAARIKQVDYIAFGDSVAAGVIGNGLNPGGTTSSNKGYTDNINKMIRAIIPTGTFNEDFCVSGHTSSSLLEQMNSNKENFISLVKTAEVITIDIGANDLLGPLYAYFDACREAGIPLTVEGAMPYITQIIYNLNTTGNEVQTNLQTILQSMLSVNRNVKIYVMGYYNPLPALKTMINCDLTPYVAYFNTFILKAITTVALKNLGTSIMYVPTMIPMAANPDVNLSFPDIHPTETGYLVIANQFWNWMKYAIR